MQQRFLVIGGTGVAGGAAIEAVHRHYGKDAHVTALWYGRKQEELAIEGAHTVLFGDISNPQAWDSIEAASGRAYTALFYATALGDVGFPSYQASAGQIAESNRLSFDPLPQLEKRFDCAAVFSYSTFYNLAHQRVTYGAMAHSKAALEAWTTQPGKSRRVCIRAGAFVSASSQAIKLLVRRNAAKLATSDDPILRQYFTDVKPSEAVENMQQAVFDEEREQFGDTGTDREGLILAHLRAFAEPDARFVCVAGKRVWVEAEPQPVL
ncbi:MAG: hypothetical protein OEW11_01665 [Nitrospirota bacterium]|nr:hypothetical protein [Nitrospirota bacterium]